MQRKVFVHTELTNRGHTMTKRRCFTMGELVRTVLLAGGSPGLTSSRSENDGALTRPFVSRRRAGFTMLELMVVLVVAGVLVAITGKGLASAFSGNSRTSATRVVGTTLFQAK